MLNLRDMLLALRPRALGARALAGNTPAAGVS